MVLVLKKSDFFDHHIAKRGNRLENKSSSYFQFTLQNSRMRSHHYNQHLYLLSIYSVPGTVWCFTSIILTTTLQNRIAISISGQRKPSSQWQNKQLEITQNMGNIGFKISWSDSRVLLLTTAKFCATEQIQQEIGK